jgi:hypothetical protein
MKKISTLVAVFLVIMYSRAMAQTAAHPYEFSYTTENTYTPLSSNAIELIGSTGWDDEIIPFTLPFNFYYTGTLVQSWLMDTYGGLYPVGANATEDTPPILGFYSDYADRGNSRIAYEVTGITGNRIAKIEYHSLGFFSDTLLVDSASFQIWLYEGSNKIEYHAGPSQVSPNRFNYLAEDGGIILIGLNYTSHGMETPAGDDTFHFAGKLNGTPTDSIVVFNNNSGPADPAMIDFINFGSFPIHGAVFTFSPPMVPPLAINDVAPEKLSSVYPNPVTHNITLHLNKAPAKGSIFKIYDVAGRELITTEITEQDTSIPMSTLLNGIYMGTLHISGRKETTRIVKQ